MIKTRYADDVIVNRLIHAIGIQAKRDYIDAREALKHGSHVSHGKPAKMVIREIEAFIREMVDYEAAEYWIEMMKKLTPADRNIGADTIISNGNRREK